jgi:tRNA pseudouridine65 synthase
MIVLASGEGWAVIDKPSGVAVHRSALVHDRVTLMDTARRHFGQPGMGPVHRLDRATSGCLLLSLNPQRTGVLHEGLKAGRKTYLVLVRGQVAPLEPILYEGELSSEHGEPKEAQTVFVPLVTCADPRCSLLLAIPLTGRRHQIRRHLRDLSHPVLGDSSHGDTRVNREWRDRFGLDRLALHCLELEIVVPDTGERIAARSPLPTSLSPLQRLPLWPEACRALPGLLEIP